MVYTSKEQYERVYYARKQAYLDYLGGKCQRCSSTEGLEFDHVYWRDKSFTIMNAWGWADQSKVYAELDKCQLLCGEHHKAKTKQDQAEMSYYKPIKHGSVYAWQKLKCQCEECTTQRHLWYDARNEKRRTGARAPYRTKRQSV